MWRRGCGALILLAALAGCAGKPTQPVTTPPPPAQQAWASMSLPDGVEELRLESGQLLITDSGGPSALFFALFSAEFSPFVHAGVLAMEEGDPFVYEVYGRFRPGLGSRPTDLVKGRVYRTPLADFVSRGKYVEIYRPPAEVDRERLMAFVREHYREQTPFDPYFDFDDPSAFYCTEFVALAWQAGGYRLPSLVPFPDNPSLSRTRRWLGIDGRGTLHARQLIDEDRKVGVLSALDSHRGFPVYFEIKRELHRRFTRDQKLGNLFEWNGTDLVFRDDVIAFIVRGIRLYGGGVEIPPAEEVRRGIQQLADRMFGPVASLRP